MQKWTENRCINYKCILSNKVENSWEEAQEKMLCDTGLGKHPSGGHEWEFMDRDKCSVLNSTWTRPSCLCNLIVPSEPPHAESPVYTAPWFVRLLGLHHMMAWWIKQKSVYSAPFLPHDHSGPWSDAQFPSSFTNISMVSIVNGT
jgi:hypothetical protein